MSGDFHPLNDMLRAGTCVAVNLRMGFWLFRPATLPERAQRYTERSPAAIKRTLSIVPSEKRPSNRPPSSMRSQKASCRATPMV
jgi:hypothetical protein